MRVEIPTNLRSELVSITSLLVINIGWLNLRRAEAHEFSFPHQRQFKKKRRRKKPASLKKDSVFFQPFGFSFFFSSFFSSLCSFFFSFCSFFSFSFSFGFGLSCAYPPTAVPATSKARITSILLNVFIINLVLVNTLITTKIVPKPFRTEFLLSRLNTFLVKQM